MIMQALEIGIKNPK